MIKIIFTICIAPIMASQALLPESSNMVDHVLRIDLAVTLSASFYIKKAEFLVMAIRANEIRSIGCLFMAG